MMEYGILDYAQFYFFLACIAWAMYTLGRMIDETMRKIYRKRLRK